MSNKHPQPNYPPDLSECRCGKFTDSHRKAYSNSQKKFYAVCENCNGIVDENFIYEKIQADKLRSKGK